MSKHIVFFLISQLSFFSASLAQTITGVDPKQVDNRVEVIYTVSELKHRQSLNIILLVRGDLDTTYVRLRKVSGDTGLISRNGRKKIVWYDINEINLSKNESYHFKVINTLPVLNIEKAIPAKNEKQTVPGKRTFIAYSGSLVAPLGLRVGAIGGTGWYVKIQSNTHPFLTGPYTYQDEMIIGYDKFSWYQFTSEHIVSAFSLCGGVTYNVAENLLAYAGAGYGKEICLYEINEYSYEDDTQLGKTYAKDEQLSASGIAFEAGALFSFGKVLINGGISSTSFKTFNLEAGVGFRF